MRRRVYLVGLAMGTPLVALIWVLRAGDDTFIRVAYPLLTAFLLVIAFGLASRRLEVSRAERLMLVVVALLYVGRLAGLLFATENLADVRLELAESTFWIINLLFLFAYLAFDTTRALRASLSIYAAVVAVLVARLAPEVAAGAFLDEAFTFARILTFMAATIALLYGLAHVKEQLAQARVEIATMAKLAFSDSLTGLPNRRRLLEVLENRLDEAARYQHAVSVVLFDLDRFKRINDDHGHDAGDTVLKALARILESTLRGVDAFGRWGGEEFLIVAVGIREEEATALAERCRALLAGHEFPVVGELTASFGVAAHRPDESSRSLLARADGALYGAKRVGGNRVELAKADITLAAS